MYTIEWSYPNCLLSQELKNLKAKIDCMTSCATHIRQIQTLLHRLPRAWPVWLPSLSISSPPQSSAAKSTIQNIKPPYSITTVPNYYNHLEYCSLSFTISPKLRPYHRVHVDGVRLHSNGLQSHIFFYSHQCL